MSNNYKARVIATTTCGGKIDQEFESLEVATKYYDMVIPTNKALCESLNLSFTIKVDLYAKNLVNGEWILVSGIEG
jgi:hypothetical protein